MHISTCSDSLVEEAAGGESTVKSFRETDEQGFRESEVIFQPICLHHLIAKGYEKTILGPWGALRFQSSYLQIANVLFSRRLISDLNCMLLQTEVLKQLSSLGRLVVCAGNGAVQSSTNLYETCFSIGFLFHCYNRIYHD